MGLFLAVAQGSAEEPRFIHLAWKPPARAQARRAGRQGRDLRLRRPVAQAQRRHARHEDRHGRRRRRARRRWRRSPTRSCRSRCTRSPPAPRTCRRAAPTSWATCCARKAGKTVEINNTDAEGRLTLADAITYGLELQARRHPRLRHADRRLHGRARPAHRRRHEQRRRAGRRSGWRRPRPPAKRCGALPLPDRAARAAQVRRRRHEEHRRALGRRAHRRAVPAGVRRRAPGSTSTSPARPPPTRRSATSPRAEPVSRVATIVEYLRGLRVLTGAADG